jgi:hypothetical protein
MIIIFILIAIIAFLVFIINESLNAPKEYHDECIKIDSELKENGK